MDLRRLDLQFFQGRVTVLVADAAGERGLELAGERGARVLESATSLLGAVARAAGGAAAVRSLSLDFVAGVAEAVLSGGATPSPRIAGEGFERVRGAAARVAAAALGEILPTRPALSGSPSLPSFWSGLYAIGRDGWELARPAPPLGRWLAGHPQVGRRALVVGCGRGHEARLLARGGAEVVAIDFAPEAIAAARALAAREGVAVDFRERDLFRLPEDPERYDLVVEHCCFCAIDPARRPEYVEAVADVLAPGGRVVGLFWNHGRPGGPPFTVSGDELADVFARRFLVEGIEVPPDSVAARDGQELLVELRRR